MLLLPENFGPGYTRARIWDPNSPTSTPDFRETGNQPQLPNDPNDPDDDYYTSFCSGHAMLPDGRMVMVGGNPSPYNTTNRAWVFDPQDPTKNLNGSWADTCSLCQGAACDHCHMQYRRYYPTLLSLKPPYVLVASGWCDPDHDDPLCAIDPGDGDHWYPKRMEVFDSTDYTFHTVDDPLVGGGSAAVCVNDAWPCRMAATYPGLHRTPNGRILFTRTGFGHASPEPGNRGAIFEFTRLAPLHKRGRWIDMISDEMRYPDRSEGMSVQLFARTDLQGGVHTWQSRTVVFGGGRYEPCCDSSTCTDGRKSVEWIDTTDVQKDTSWNLLDQRMRDPRLHAVAVALPDGQVLVFGGNEIGETAKPLCHNSSAEMFDPVIFDFPGLGGFTPVPSLPVSRGYHIVAGLLPTGGVMVTSGRTEGPEDTRIDIFLPPYMHPEEARPVIDGVSAVATPTSPLLIDISKPAEVSKVVFVRPMSFTHHTDTEQRVLDMPFLVSGGGLLVPVGESDPVFPGYWMVFVMDTQNKLSKAKFFRIDP